MTVNAIKSTNTTAVAMRHFLYSVKLVFSKFSEWRERQAAVRALLMLDDHMLQDLGIGRDDIFVAVYGKDDRTTASGHKITKPRMTLSGILLQFQNLLAGLRARHGSGL